MRHIQLANRRDIAVRVARKHGNAVADIVFDGVNVSVLRVDVNAAVELDVCVFAADHPLRFRARGIRRSIVQPVKHPDAPGVGVLEKHLVVLNVHGDSAVDGIRVQNVSHRWPSHSHCLSGVLRGGIHRFVLERRKQIVGHQIGMARFHLFRQAHLRVFGQLLNRNQASRAERRVGHSPHFQSFHN